MGVLALLLTETKANRDGSYIANAYAKERKIPGVTPLFWLALEGGNPHISAGRCSPTLRRAREFVSEGEDVLHASSRSVRSSSVSNRHGGTGSSQPYLR